MYMFVGCRGARHRSVLCWLSGGSVHRPWMWEGFGPNLLTRRSDACAGLHERVLCGEDPGGGVERGECSHKSVLA